MERAVGASDKGPFWVDKTLARDSSTGPEAHNARAGHEKQRCAPQTCAYLAPATRRGLCPRAAAEREEVDRNNWLTSAGVSCNAGASRRPRRPQRRRRRAATSCTRQLLDVRDRPKAAHDNENPSHSASRTQVSRVARELDQPDARARADADY